MTKDDKIMSMVRNWKIHSEFDRWLLQKLVENRLTVLDLQRLGFYSGDFKLVRYGKRKIKDNEIDILAKAFNVSKEEVIKIYDQERISYEK